MPPPLSDLFERVAARDSVQRAIAEEEPPPADHPLFRCPNFIGTPHLGGTTPAGPVYGVPELRAIAAGPIDSAGGLYSSVTPTDKSFKKAMGATISLDYPRSLSPPFSYTLPANGQPVSIFWR